MASANPVAITRPASLSKVAVRTALGAGALLILAVLVWQGVTAAGNPTPKANGSTSFAGVLDIAVLVFREGLECVLVLSAITASMVKTGTGHVRPVGAGVAVGAVATLATWFAVVGVVNDLTKSINALYVQAATGLLAILVLLLVMNWFFHKMYWTGWISLHNRKKRELLENEHGQSKTQRRVLLGMALLGFTSFYREGVEVVLFLQSYRLKLGSEPVYYGVLFGVLFTAIVALLTFFAHRRLPYRRMLVFTGIMLGVVLLIMVGEQAQEMQAAHWLTTTTIPFLADKIPAWMGLWFSIFPTIESLSAQFLAAVAVLGSYFLARQ